MQGKITHTYSTDCPAVLNAIQYYIPPIIAYIIMIYIWGITIRQETEI